MKYNFLPILMMFVLFSFCVSAQPLVVAPNTNLTVAEGATITFYSITSPKLVLKSDATGDASLIENGNFIDFYYPFYPIVTQVERYLAEGQWHLISSPITNAFTGMFNGDYLQYHNENNDGWTDVVTNYILGIMKGHGLWSVEAGPTTEVFYGNTNTGELSRGFSQNGQGWNLMGNPYPSAIDWDAVTIPAELSGAIYLFDPTIGAIGDYRYYINGGGAANTTSQFIPSGQGFFVRATSGSGTLTLDNTSRVHSTQAFYKSVEKEMLVLKVTGNNVTTQTAIRFNEDATPKADRLYDVYKIVSDKPDIPNLFTKAENENMAINTLPAIEGNEIVPMWFRAGMSGEYTINATEIESFDSQTPIYIVDPETGFIQNLREDPIYIFDYKSGEDKSFLVYFIEPNQVAMSSDIQIFSHENVLNVNFSVNNLTNSSFQAQIMVYDLAGKEILQTRTTEINNRIPLKGNNSIYMIQVISDSETSSGKVFIP